MALSAERRAARRRHLVVAAQALIREQAGAGFSMTQLAARAGVSPATPYNLLGGKAEILRLVVREEFESFSDRLTGEQDGSPLRRLLAATALVVTHYEADRPFYRGLYHAMSSEAGEVHDLMSAQGNVLWRGLVRDAVAGGELVEGLRVEPFTNLLLRTIAVTTQAWLAGNWTEERFALEMASSMRLILASVASPSWRDPLVREAMAAHGALEALSAPALSLQMAAS